MRMSELGELLTYTLRANRNVLIEGNPGGGKTMLAHEAAEDIGAHVIYRHAPSIQPEDLGVPDMSQPTLIFKVNDDIPVYGSRWDPAVNPDAPDRIVFILDEVTQCDHGTQKTLGNMIQQKECYGKKLLPWVTFIGTGNLTENRAGAGKLLTHFSDRWIRIRADFFIDDWLDWTLAKGVNPVVRAFGKFASKHICDFKPDRDVNPTPRGWVEKVAPMLDVGTPIHLLNESLKGSIGDEAASAFVTFIKMASHLNIDALMADPDNHPLPTDSSTLLVIATTLAMKSTVKNFDTVMRVANRMPGEFGVVLVLEASKVEPRVMSTAAYAEWAVGPGAAVLGIR